MEPTQKQTNAIPAAIIVAGLIIGGSILLTSTPRQAPPAQAIDGQSPTTVDVSKITTLGEPTLGVAQAPVTIAYWYDYQCPFCKQHEQTAMPQLITEYVQTGKAKIVFKDFQFLGADSQTAGLASRAVWELAPEKFYDWHKAMYEKQDGENSGWGNQKDILALTNQMLGPEIGAKVADFMTKNAERYQKEIEADKAEGSAAGVTGTPGFVIGDQLVVGAQPYPAIKAAIEAAFK